MNADKTNIRTLDQDALKETMVRLGQPSFRAKQVHEWLWVKNAGDFTSMTNIPKELISRLDEEFFIPSLLEYKVQESNDGTVKSGFQLHDGKIIEGVLIPQGKRMTACISSQVGCSLTCSFCATGQMKMDRNLSAYEMYDQVVAINNQAIKHFDRHLSNIVYMGMGEPLLNYREVMASVDMLTSSQGLSMSPRRITVSTAGIAKMIRKLGDDEVRFNLALSLHAANDEKRNSIMPINESNNLKALSEALRHFQAKTGSRITFEYIVFNDFNDSLQDARELAELCKAVACKINLIEYNPVKGVQFRKAGNDRIDAFKEFLESRNLVVNVRRSRGKDIDAACGQLANKGAES